MAAEPISDDAGNVAVVSPAGSAGTVPADQLAAALRMGYRLEAPDEHRERRLQESYGDRPFTAAGLGALGALTFGGSDAILGGIGEVQGGDNAIREIAGRNRGARAVGEIGGLLTGAGAAGLLTRAGEGAAKVTGGGLMGALASGAAQGGLVGAQQAVSEIALSEDPLTAESIAGTMFHHVLAGAALGGAGGGLGELVGRAAGRVRGVFARAAEGLDAKAASMTEIAALKTAHAAEFERLTTEATALRPQVMNDLRALRPDMKALREAMGARVRSASEEIQAGLQNAERSVGGIHGSPAALATPKGARSALDTLASYRDNLAAVAGAEPTAAAAGMLFRVQGIEARIEQLAAPPTSLVLEDLAGKLAAAAKAVPEGSAASELVKAGVKQGTSAAAYGAANAAGAALGLPGAGLIAHFLAGKMAGKVGDLMTGQIGIRSAEVGSRIASAASAVAGAVERGAVPAFARAAATIPSFEATRDSLLTAAADPVGTRERIDANLDGVRARDPVLADQIAGIQTRAVEHLAAVMPRAAGGPTLGDSSAHVSPMQRDRFMRRVEVVTDPTVLLAALESGTLTPTMLETADAVYGVLTATLRTRVIQSLEGREIPMERRLVLSMLLGAPVVSSLAPANVAAAQARMAQEVRNMATPPPSPQPSSPANMPRPEDATGSQRYTGR